MTAACTGDVHGTPSAVAVGCRCGTPPADRVSRVARRVKRRRLAELRRIHSAPLDPAVVVGIACALRRTAA